MTNRHLRNWLLGTSLFIMVCILVGGSVGCSSPDVSTPPDTAILPDSPSLPEKLGLIVIKDGVAAPDFTLPTMTGTDITLSNLQGKPVVLNFWATWCPYCVAELPYFDKAIKEHAGEVTIVALDIQEEASQVKNFLQKLFDGKEVSFIVALDKNAQVASAYGAGRYIPVTFFIDSQGIIRYAKAGAFPDEKNLQDSIALLLEG